jgi:hypothetical protein
MSLQIDLAPIVVQLGVGALGGLLFCLLFTILAVLSAGSRFEDVCQVTGQFAGWFASIMLIVSSVAFIVTTF